MALSTQDQQDAARKWVANQFVSLNVTAVINHTDIVAAIAALDAALDSDPSTLVGASVVLALNNALPQTAKTQLSVAQKSVLLCYVVMKRAGLI